MENPFVAWLPAAEAARHAGISRPRIHQLVKAGALEGTTVAGRLLIHRTSLDHWAATRPTPKVRAPHNMEDLRRRRSDILEIARHRGVHNVRVFGSVAHGTADDTSDVDLLVDLDSTSNAMNLCGFAFEVEQALGCKVDVLAPTRSSPALEKILKEAQLL